MFEQLTTLARRDRNTRNKDARPALNDNHNPRDTGTPDPLVLSISGVLLFVVIVVVLVFRTLYPVAP